jgi:hypothetical protein
MMRICFRAATEASKVPSVALSKQGYAESGKRRTAPGSWKRRTMLERGYKGSLTEKDRSSRPSQRQASPWPSAWDGCHELHGQEQHVHREGATSMTGVAVLTLGSGGWLGLAVLVLTADCQHGYSCGGLKVYTYVTRSAREG